MKKIGFLILLFFFIENVYADTFIKKVEFSKCVDGDTAYFTVDNETLKFRFLAIDTPEKGNAKKAADNFGKEASDYTCEILTNAKDIIIEFESSYQSDKYGRSLGWVWTDGVLLQQKIIENGYGQVAYIYGKYKYTDALCLLQKNAEEAKTNVWSNDDYIKGYCKTLDLTNIKNNINFEEIANMEVQSEKINDVANKLNKYEEKFSNYIDDNSEKISQIFLYVFIIVSIGAMVYREFKK